MKILAVDAATEACSAALLAGELLIERFEVIGRGHAGRLLPMADELLRETGLSVHELDGIAFGRGPGGFTGLRIAAGVAQGLAAGAGRPIVPVSNLAAVAAGAGRTTGADRVLACTDARMGQVYWAAYEDALADSARRDRRAIERPRRSGGAGGRSLAWRGPWLRRVPGDRGAPRPAARAGRCGHIAARQGHCAHRRGNPHRRQGLAARARAARVPARRRGAQALRRPVS